MNELNILKQSNILLLLLFNIWFFLMRVNGFWNSTELIHSQTSAEKQRELSLASFGYGQHENLQKGSWIDDYQLLERTASLGRCDHRPSLPSSQDMCFSTSTYPLLLRMNRYEVVLSHLNRENSFDSISLQNLPQLEYQCMGEEEEKEKEKEDENSMYLNEDYHLRKKFNKGSHGEVWRASKISKEGIEEIFVLKRIFVEEGVTYLQSGLREIHFGKLLQNQHHITRFVESFYREGKQKKKNKFQELWLVFHDEGKSLRDFIYQRHEGGGGVIYEPSKFWYRLRQESRGMEVLKETIRQILQAVETIHSQDIVHRDIKPSNILINQKETSPTLLKFADFGSAVDAYTLNHLYGSKGPSQSEETREYQPPEVLLSSMGLYNAHQSKAYDLWSVGIVILEIFLASVDIFSLSSREKAQINHMLKDKDEETKHKSYLIHSFSQWCIYRPQTFYDTMNRYALVSTGCHMGKFNETLTKKDSLKKGFQDQWGLDLLWRLLQWDPNDRISASEALQHAYFKGSFRCNITQREFATQHDLIMHQEYLRVQQERNEQGMYVYRDDLPTSFKCPFCHRVFDAWNSCNAHLHGRKHNQNKSNFCEYSKKTLQQYHPHSFHQFLIDDSLSLISSLSNQFGVFSMSGRRSYMEDRYIIDHTSWYSLYGVLDGHTGIGAVEFVQDKLPIILRHHLVSLDVDESKKEDFRLLLELSLQQTFYDLQMEFVDNFPSTDFSGTTISLILLWHQQKKKNRIVVANVGDSKAILVLNHHSNSSLDIKTLTKSHVPQLNSEKHRIESSGGFIEFQSVWRVMGQLAISRSIGDRHLRQYLSQEPWIDVMSIDDSSYLFIIMASDGVWDTMTNEQAALFVQETYQKKSKQSSIKSSSSSILLNEIAQLLVYEAYVRGSTDNLCALIIPLSLDMKK